MAELTATQRSDMQADLGITADETVFTNEELDRLYTRAETKYELAVYFGYRQILADAAKLHAYRVGQTSMSEDQVFDHLTYMLELWGKEARVTADQVKIASMRSVPPRNGRRPNEARRPWLRRRRGRYFI